MLRGTGEISAAEAERIQARGHLASQYPKVAASLDAGEARTENVDTLAAVTAKMTASEKKRMGALDGELAELAGRLPPETFARNVKRKARQLKDPDPAGESESKAERQRKASHLELRRGRDGMWRLRGQFDDQRGAEINDLINQVARTLTDPSGPGPTGNDRAAALHDLVTRPTGGEDSDVGAGRPRMGIGYIVDARTLFDEPHQSSTAQTWDGDDIDPRAAKRLACDTEHWGVLIDRLSQPTRVGRTRRAATREQRLQLRTLYPHCPLDGHTPFGRCEVHHVNVFYEDGGDTDIDNLLPVSTQWHHVNPSGSQSFGEAETLEVSGNPQGCLANDWHPRTRNPVTPTRAAPAGVGEISLVRDVWLGDDEHHGKGGDQGRGVQSGAAAASSAPLVSHEWQKWRQ